MNKFNIRIYALLIHENKLLLLREPFAGKLIIKFPGGGLEYGESTLECVKREFLEELNLHIDVESHFYTQDFYLASAHNPQEQMLLIYYKVSTKDISNLQIMDKNINELLWIPLSEIKTDDFALPSDKIVIEMLIHSS